MQGSGLIYFIFVFKAWAIYETPYIYLLISLAFLYFFFFICSLQSSAIAEFEKGVIVSESQNYARLLMETPANHMTPSIFASNVAEKFKNSQVKVIIR